MEYSSLTDFDSKLSALKDPNLPGDIIDKIVMDDDFPWGSEKAEVAKDLIASHNNTPPEQLENLFKNAANKKQKYKILRNPSCKIDSIIEDVNLFISFDNVLREYDERGSLKFLDGSVNSGYFKGLSEEKVTYYFDLNNENIDEIQKILEKIERIKTGEKNIKIHFTELPEYFDEEYDSHSYETSGDKFYIEDSEIDKKLYFSEDIFESGRWDGNYSTQQYDYDDKMILVDFTDSKSLSPSPVPSLDWDFE